jgi:DNA-binding NarL/FixJ family response regulator
MGELKQTMIDGCADEVPAEVREAADDYLTAKRAVARNREKMNNSLVDLVVKMKEADVAEMLIGDGEKKLILTAKDQIKIKARKRAKTEAKQAPPDIGPSGDGDDALEANILRLSNSGKGAKAIAEEVGVSERQVRKALGRL